MNESDIRERVGKAIRKFWKTRQAQRRRQGKGRRGKDAGDRAAVTGGAQLDGFISLLADLIAGSRIPRDAIQHTVRATTYLPGFFRPTKSWDVLVTVGGRLLACVEFKSQVGSFGNDFNNRAEESVGNAHDFWTAYREGAFAGSPRPWLGYFMVLEEAPASMREVKVNEPHFRVFEEFRGASYARRYELLCLKLLRERLYDGTCFLLTGREAGARGEFTEPNSEVGVMSFVRSLLAHVSAQGTGVSQ